MKPSPTHAPVVPLSDRDERIKRLPDAARTAFQQFQLDGNPERLDPVLWAILMDFVPKATMAIGSETPGATRLIEDLGFDSLAITEVVFFTEDLFGITITNEEIVQVRTLDDLRAFLRAKVAVRPPS